MQKQIVVLFLLFCISVQTGFAQTKDTVKVKKNLRFSILGGPGYTPDYGFLLGGSALFTFSTDREDTLLKRSVLPVAFAYMTAGGGSIIVKPQLFFNHDRFRIFGQFSLSNTIDNYYGVGYEKNSQVKRHADSTEYRNYGYKINPIFLFRYKTTNLFWGGSLDINYKNMKDPALGIQNDDDFLAQGGDLNGLKFLNMGLGAHLNYDTRDVPANAYSGMLFDFGAKFYSKSLGSSTSFNVFDIEYRQYKELEFIGERKVLAWIVNGRFTTGEVPITDLSMIGSAFDLRGYYAGQYRNRNAVFGLAEYRHMFNLGEDTKLRFLLSKTGFVAWAGLGTTEPVLQGQPGLLPNFGGGFRIEVQPRMNFRVDIGRDPLNKQTLLYFNMTEAF